MVSQKGFVKEYIHMSIKSVIIKAIRIIVNVEGNKNGCIKKYV